MVAVVTGHLSPNDVQLIGEETADDKAYYERTLPNLIKMAYQGRAENGGRLILSIIELRKLDSMRGMNCYILEPIGTYEARSRVVYTGGARRHNIRGVVQLQRLLARDQFCPLGAQFPQERCTDEKCSDTGISGCRLAMCQVDGGHNVVGLLDMLSSTALNATVALRL